MYLLLWIFCLTCYSDQFHLYFENNASEDLQRVSYIAAEGLFYFLSLEQSVNIKIEWVPLGSGVLGSSFFPTGCQDETRNIYIILPPSLYVQKYGNAGNCRTYDGSVFYHMTVQINSDPSVQFYWQNNQTVIQQNEYDALTTLRHEMMHGLGKKSSILSSDGIFGLAPMGHLYDWIVFSEIGEWPTLDSGTPLKNPTFQNGYTLGQPLFFPCNHPFLLNVESTNFANGVPVAHDVNSGLMNYKLGKGQSRPALSMYDIAMLQKLGYNTTHCDSPDMSTPCAFCVPNQPCSSGDSMWMFSFFHFLFN